MNLKILHIDTKSIIRNSISSKSILQSRIIEEKEFMNSKYFVFSSYVESSSESFGVQDSKGSITSLTESLKKENKQLLKCRFIIVDVFNKLVYYDGNLLDIKEVLQKLFDIEHKEILINVEIDEFERLKKLKIRTIKNGQMGINDLNSKFDKSDDFINSVAKDQGEIESTSYEIIFKREGGIFDRDKFNEILKDSQSGLRIITAEGFDKNGHEIKLSSHIHKKITILESDSSWSKRLQLSLERVLVALLEEIK